MSNWENINCSYGIVFIKDFETNFGTVGVVVLDSDAMIFEEDFDDDKYMETRNIKCYFDTNRAVRFMGIEDNVVSVNALGNLIFNRNQITEIKELLRR